MWRMWSAISDAVYVTERRAENTEQKTVEAKGRIKPSILCLFLSNWVNVPLESFSKAALSNSLMRAAADKTAICVCVSPKLDPNWAIIN